MRVRMTIVCFISAAVQARICPFSYQLQTGNQKLETSNRSRLPHHFLQFRLRLFGDTQIEDIAGLDMVLLMARQLTKSFLPRLASPGSRRAAPPDGAGLERGVAHVRRADLQQYDVFSFSTLIFHHPINLATFLPSLCAIPMRSRPFRENVLSNDTAWSHR